MMVNKFKFTVSYFYQTLNNNDLIISNYQASTRCEPEHFEHKKGPFEEPVSWLIDLFVLG